MTTARARAALGAVALVVAAGCWNTRLIEERDWGAIPPEEVIRVTTLDGARHTLTGVTATTSALRGHSPTTDSTTASRLAVNADSVRIPLDSIEFIEIRRFAVARTALLLAAGGTAIGIIAAQGKSDVRPPPPETSCPFVYAFDGETYRLDSETFAGAVARGLERTDLDNLEHVRPVGGEYRLLLTNERPEVQYTDLLQLVVADHPADVIVVPDATQRLRAVRDPAPPVSARATHGNVPALPLISDRDGAYWTGGPLEDVDPADPAELRDGLELVFERPRTDRAALVVHARNTALAPFALRTFLELHGDDLVSWYRAVARHEDERARVRGWIAREGMLHVSVWQGGRWVRQAALLDVGPHLPKTQVALLDLSDMADSSVRVRLEAARGLWMVDQVSLGAEADTSLRIQEVEAARAVDRGGTDRRGVLGAEDGAYHVALPGDTVELAFPEPAGGASDGGLRRSVLVRSRGFYYLASDQSGPSRALVADRILDEPLFGNRYILQRWQAERAAP